MSLGWISSAAWLHLPFATPPASFASVPSQMSLGWIYHQHTDTRSCSIAPKHGGSGRRLSCRWSYVIGYKRGSDASHQGTPGEEEHPIQACELLLALEALEALAGWPSSSWVLASSGWVQHSPPPAVVLVPLPVPTPSPDQSLAQDQVTSQVGEQLERPGELAAREVQLSMLAARREIS